MINREKKESVFVQNRVARISSTFTDDDLMHIKTQDNIADYGTRPQNISSNFNYLQPEGIFRTGPAFLTKGLEQAIQDNDVVLMNQLAQNIQQQEMEQILDLPNNTQVDTDPITLDSNEQKNNAIDTVLLLNFKSTTFLEDVESCTDFSNYIIHPLKLSYKKFHLSLTICFKFISVITSKSTTKAATTARTKVLQGTNNTTFAPTVDHLVQSKPVAKVPIIPPNLNETNRLDYYKPYLPTDQSSKLHLSEWINYPGLLKITRISRQLHKWAELPRDQKNTKAMIQLANILKTNIRILANSQVSPITTSMAIAAMKTATKTTPEIRPILIATINGDQEGGGILKKTRSLVTSPNTWPTRQKHTINHIFNTNDIRKFSCITENYLNQKASNEVQQFISPKVLTQIAVKHQGLWLAKNRTLLSNSPMNSDGINPILRYNRSPLTIAMAKFNHTINDKHEPARPSSCFHSGYKQNQTKFLKYGVIYRGAPYLDKYKRPVFNVK